MNTIIDNRDKITSYTILAKRLEIQEVNDQYAYQEVQKHHYDQKIKELTIAAATQFNEQVS